jgi:hypothetical protein
MYDWQDGPDAPCEILTFDSHGAFTGSFGDSGKWSSNTKKTTLTYASGGDFSGKFVGVLEDQTEPAATYGGNFTEEGAPYGPGSLVSGSNPLSDAYC